MLLPSLAVTASDPSDLDLPLATLVCVCVCATHRVFVVSQGGLPLALDLGGVDASTVERERVCVCVSVCVCMCV